MQPPRTANDLSSGNAVKQVNARPSFEYMYGTVTGLFCLFSKTYQRRILGQFNPYIKEKYLSNSKKLAILNYSAVKDIFMVFL